MKRETILKIFSNIPTLDTEHLILRKMSVRDTDDMNEYARLAEVTKYLTWSPHPSRNYTREYLEYIGSRYIAGEFYDWAVVERKSGKMIGTCGFTRFDYHSNAGEVGYVLNPAYWGNGYATEAARAVIKFGFESLLLNRISAMHIEGNSASRHVMERVGMQYEGTLRGYMLVKNQYKDICICSLLRDDYYSNIYYK